MAGDGSGRSEGPAGHGPLGPGVEGPRRPAPAPPEGVAFTTVTDPEQARLLTDAASQRLFRPFLARDLTVTAAARETGVDTNAVLYRVRQFLRAGLLKVVREVKRPGRPIKVYRSAHDAYFVPYELTPFASLEERMLAQLRPHLEERVRTMARRLREHGWSGQLLFRDDQGETWMASAADPVARLDWLDSRLGVGIDYIVDLELTEDEAAELHRLLYAVLDRYERGAGSGRPAARGYTLSVALYRREGP